MSQSQNAIPDQRPRAAGRWALLLLLACCAALLSYIVINWRTQRRAQRELKEVTRSEVVKRDELIADLQGKVDRLRQELTGPSAGRMCAALDGSWIAQVDGIGVVSIRAVETGKELASIKERVPCFKVEVPAFPHRLALTFRSRTGQEKEVGTTQLWEVKPETDRLQVRKMYTLDGDQVQFSGDGSRCLTRGERLHVWDTATGRKLASFPPADRRDLSLPDLAGWALLPNGLFCMTLTKRGEFLRGEVDSGKMQVVAPPP
jgi:hypothetical protein